MYQNGHFFFLLVQLFSKFRCKQSLHNPIKKHLQLRNYSNTQINHHTDLKCWKKCKWNFLENLYNHDASNFFLFPTCLCTHAWIQFLCSSRRQHCCIQLFQLKKATGASTTLLYPSVIRWMKWTLYFLKPSVTHAGKKENS